jgi:hypothetical protein
MVTDYGQTVNHNPVTPVTSTPTPILVRRALTCRRLRECGSPFPPGYELQTVRAIGGLDAVRAEIRRRETIGGAQ